MGLRYFDGGVLRRISALMVPLDSTTSAVAVLGLVLNTGRGSNEMLRRALLQARDQVAAGLEET